jgi:hypothetical protein
VVLMNGPDTNPEVLMCGTRHITLVICNLYITHFCHKSHINIAFLTINNVNVNIKL